jgi:hypothetical protein
MMNTIQIGSKVRRQHDDGWASPGCVISQSKDKLRVYWPDENIFTCESADNLALYDMVSQPQEIAA